MITQAGTRQAGQRAAGVAAQVVLLAVLGAGVGLGSVGWLTGIGFAVLVWALLTATLQRSPMARLGPADGVTQVRAVLVGGVAAMVADGPAWLTATGPLVALASVALVLDAVDGQVARRTGTASALGARFDMEVDAFLILVLSVHVAGRFGVWVLAIGALRYLFVGAAGVVPWLRAELPPSFGRKTVAAVQGIVLVVASSGLLPHLVAVSGLVLGLGLLVWSFGRDTLWLWENTGRPAAWPEHRIGEREHRADSSARCQSSMREPITRGWRRGAGQRCARSRRRSRSGAATSRSIQPTSRTFWTASTPPTRL